MDEFEFELSTEQQFELERMRRVMEEQIKQHSTQEVLDILLSSFQLQMQYTNVIRSLVRENSKLSRDLINALSLLKDKINPSRKIDLPKL